MWDRMIPGRDLGRAFEIASTFARYGGGDLVRRLRLAAMLHRAGHVLPAAAHLEEFVALSPPVRTRRAFEALGPTFVKLGQVLATRVDLFTDEWIEQFGALQNQVPAAPYEEVRAQLIEDLGAPPEQVFAHFDPAPLAAASIAQVYRARLDDGTEVVVKVRRPGIRPVIEADLRLLQRVAQAMETHLPEMRRYEPVAVVAQFRESLRRELDLAAECRHAERIAASFASDDTLLIPKVHWHYCGERVNVQDFVRGIAVCDLPALAAAGIDPRVIAKRGAQAILAMMLRDGFFHADPHPGNVFALAGDRIALIDFGMVGRLSGLRRTQVVNLLHALVERDAEAVTETLLGWTDAVSVDEERLGQDVDTFIDHYHGVPLGQLDLGAMLLEIAALLREHRLRLPPDLALLIKVCITLEGMGRTLDPAFDMASEAEPFLRRALIERYAPRAVLRRGARAMAELVDTAAALPHDLRRAARALRSGRMRLNLRLDQLTRFGRQVDHSANRLTMGIVVAALVIGSSITMTVGGGPELLGLPAFGLLGFIGAVLAGAWLMLSIWRSGGGR
jgi:ubiquinone biosynthesis protein